MSLSTSRSIDIAVGRIAEVVSTNESKILSYLTTQCTLHSARIEIEQVLELSADLSRCISNRPEESDTSQVYTFLPRNNILYSLALYALIPLALGYTTHIRAPAALRHTVKRIWELSGFSNFEQANLHLGSQREFTQQIQPSDTIIFTGQSDNGKRIESENKYRLFLGFGSSYNPFIVMPGASIERVVDDLIFARMFNSGADCLAPDIVFVHRSMADQLIDALIAKLNELPVLEREVADVIAHTNSPDSATVERATSIIHTYRHRLIWSHGASGMNDFVPTTILLSDIEEPIVSEIFASIFNLIAFNKPIDVTNLLSTDHFRGSEMYLSHYGTEIDSIPPGHVVCQDSSPFDHESALTPFGGYGATSTWRTHDGVTSGQPISIFHELGGIF